MYSRYNRKHMVHTLGCEIPQVRLQSAGMPEGK